MFEEDVRAYLERARLGRLATADGSGRPAVVPVCFAISDGTVVTPIDEKPKAAGVDELRRVRDIRENPAVALVVDHYDPDWSNLGWVQIRGRATVIEPGDGEHGDAVEVLREAYDQYADHDLESRPVLGIDPGSVLTWGDVGTPVGSTAKG